MINSIQEKKIHMMIIFSINKNFFNYFEYHNFQYQEFQFRHRWNSLIHFSIRYSNNFFGFFSYFIILKIWVFIYLGCIQSIFLEKFPSVFHKNFYFTNPCAHHFAPQVIFIAISSILAFSLDFKFPKYFLSFKIRLKFLIFIYQSFILTIYTFFWIYRC